MRSWSFYAHEKNPEQIVKFCTLENGTYYSPFSPSYRTLKEAQLWMKKNGGFFVDRGVVLKLFVNKKLIGDVVFQQGDYDIKFRKTALAKKQVLKEKERELKHA